MIELLGRHPPLDLAPIRAVCGRFGLGATLDEVLAEARLPA